MVGYNYPTKLDNINIGDGAFDGKTAHAEAIFDITKKVRISTKAKKMIRKDEKLNAMYNRLDRQFEKSETDKKEKAKFDKHNKIKKHKRR